jgi:hypothetical protein
VQILASTAYAILAEMARGTLRQTSLKKEDQFMGVVDDMKIRMSLATLADKYSTEARELIQRTYDDPDIAATYRAMRASGIYQHGGKSKVRRKIVEFPNHYVFDFVDTVMTSMYGEDWLNNTKALRHELVKPWHVVKHL